MHLTIEPATASTLERFCKRPDEQPESMRKPWLYEGWAYACDGTALVRMRREGLELLKATEAAWSVGERRLPLSSARDRFSVMEYPWKFQLFVPDCLQTARRTCPRCDGAGFLECDLGHEHDCPRCKGDGLVDRWWEAVPGHFAIGRHVRELASIEGIQVATPDASTLAFRSSENFQALLATRLGAPVD
jgi:hypothetical protein